MAGVAQLVESGPLLLAMPVAAAAGAVTFLSPCCLPLVPGYLSYLTGMSGAGLQPAGGTAGRVPALASQATAGSLQAGAARGGPAPAPASVGDTGPGAPTASHIRSRAVLGTLLFILGFSVVFTLESATVGSLGYALRAHHQGLTQVLGILVILLGLVFVGAFDRFSVAGRIFRPQFRPRAGLAGAPLLGVVFAVSWTPCIGPTLAAVLLLASTTGGAGRAALLGLVYALGLGVPFLIVAFAVQRGVSLFGWARRHARLITQIGGVLLIGVGVLEVTGAWSAAVIWLQVHWFPYSAPL